VVVEHPLRGRNAAERTRLQTETDVRFHAISSRGVHHVSRRRNTMHTLVSNVGPRSLVVLTLIGLVFLARGSSATLYTIVTQDDNLITDGTCTLREALLAASTNADVDSCPAGSGEPTTDEIELSPGRYD